MYWNDSRHTADTLNKDFMDWELKVFQNYSPSLILDYPKIPYVIILSRVSTFLGAIYKNLFGTLCVWVRDFHKWEILTAVSYHFNPSAF